MKPVDSLNADELHAEAAKIRKEIVASAERLTKVCETLYTMVRRNPSDDTSAFVSIANANKRFSGSVLQGAKRTESVDRILIASRRASQEEQERREQLEARKKRAALERLRREAESSRSLFSSSYEELTIEGLLAAGTPESDLNDLYGDE